MTTTTTSNAPGIYEVFERLPEVECDPALAELCQKITDLARELEPTLIEARRALAEHEKAATTIIERTIEETGLDDHDDDGLYALMAYLSGARGLHMALSRLRDLSDPDVLLKD